MSCPRSKCSLFGVALPPLAPFPTLGPLLLPHRWAPFLLALHLAAACMSFGATLSGASLGVPSVLAGSVRSPRAPDSTQQHPCVLLVPFLPVYLCLGDASPLSTPDHVIGQLFLLGPSHSPGPWPLLGHQYFPRKLVRAQATGAKPSCMHFQQVCTGPLPSTD